MSWHSQQALSWAGRTRGKRQQTPCFLPGERCLLRSQAPPRHCCFSSTVLVGPTGLIAIKKNHLEVGKERSFPLDKDNQILRNYLKRQSCLSDLFGCSKHGAATPPSEGKAFFFPPPFALLSKQPDGLTTKLRFCPEAPVRLRAEEKCQCGVRGLSQRLLVHQTPPPDPTRLRQPRQDARCPQSPAGARPTVSE